MISNAYAQDATTTATTAPAGNGVDAAESSSPFGAIGQFMPIIVIFAVFYFLLIRPQQKQQKTLRKMISDAKRGDEVITNSGLHGKIIEVKDDIIMFQAANNVTLKMERSAIQRIKGYQTK
jgi:preprotein translocase subunit YajC